MSLEINTDDFWKEIDKRVVEHRIEKKLMSEEITKLREQLAAQAAVIESLKEALHYSLGAWEYDGVSDEHGSTFREANDRCDTPTDSTQILDEVRRAERERVAKMVRDCMFKIGQSSPYRELVSELLDAIRAME